MSGRRLPLHASASASGPGPASPGELGSLRLAGRSIAVADTGTCELAMRWAARLAQALIARGAAVDVLLTSFDAHIDISSAQRTSFGDARLHTLTLGASARLPDDLPNQPDALWLVVGQPALASFESSLSVLLGTGLPVLRWPETVRASRDRCTVSMTGEGLAVADALAAQLRLA